MRIYWQLLFRIKYQNLRFLQKKKKKEKKWINKRISQKIINSIHFNTKPKPPYHKTSSGQNAIYFIISFSRNVFLENLRII